MGGKGSGKPAGYGGGKSKSVKDGAIIKDKTVGTITTANIEKAKVGTEISIKTGSNSEGDIIAVYKKNKGGSWTKRNYNGGKEVGQFELYFGSKDVAKHIKQNSSDAKWRATILNKKF